VSRPPAFFAAPCAPSPIGQKAQPAAAGVSGEAAGAVTDNRARGFGPAGWRATSFRVGRALNSLRGWPADFSFSLAERTRILTGAFQHNAFGCGRYNPRGKSSGPALLEPSLKVQRYVAHNLNSALAAEVHRR
jgi:hypothetical protein